MTSIQGQLHHIEERLASLREDWKHASPVKRKFIEAGAKLLKEKRDRLEQLQQQG